MALSELSTEEKTDQFATNAFYNESARELLLERFATARSSVWVAIGDVGPEWREPFAMRVEELLEVGIDVRLLVTDIEVETPRLAEVTEAGLDVRITDAVPHHRFIVIDGEEVCLEVLDPSHEDDCSPSSTSATTRSPVDSPIASNSCGPRGCR